MICLIRGAWVCAGLDMAADGWCRFGVFLSILFWCWSEVIRTMVGNETKAGAGVPQGCLS